MTIQKRLFSLIIRALIISVPISFVGHANAQETEQENSDLLVSIFRDVYPYWSPDGKKIAFHTNRVSKAD